MDPLYPVPVYAHGDEDKHTSPYSFKDKLQGAMPATTCPGRIAVYDALPGSIPRTLEIQPCPIGEFLDILTQKTHEFAGGSGGSIPFTVIREIVENFIHADFTEPVISIFDEGQTIRFADQGPGIEDKEKALLPGFTSANKDAKVYIRGVGSGLPIVSDFLSLNGGSLIIEDNLGHGTVVTITTKKSAGEKSAVAHSHVRESKERRGSNAVPKEITGRQMNILALMVEKGSLGPTVIADELGISIATAHRDLESMESLGLVEMGDDRKRVITDEGYECLNNQVS